MKEDILRRFKDLNDLSVPEGFIEPCLNDVSTVPQVLQENRTDMQSDLESPSTFSNSGLRSILVSQTQFASLSLEGSQNCSLWYFPPHIKGLQHRIANSYKNRNQMDITERGDLRLLLSNIELEIRGLAQSHQAQGAHRNESDEISDNYFPLMFHVNVPVL